MATEAPSKRLRTDVVIGTHNGHFHADEALAVYMLRQLPAYKNADLIRTRDPKVLETCHTVVDVGGEYDPARNRYDHHQRGFDTVFPGRTTKLSSAGLVYMHFGRALIAQALAAARNNSTAEVSDSDADVSLLYPKIYESFIEALDAHDNGISAYDPAALEAAGITKRFSNGGFTLGAMVGRFNPNWNDPVSEDPTEAQAQEDRRFVAASERIGEELSRELEYYAKAWLPARDVVSAAFAARKDVDLLGRVMIFQGTSAPWKDHLYALEEEAASAGEEVKVLYVLYPEKPVPGAKWRVQCVPESKDSFVSRKPLPAAWRGFRDEELDGISGIPGCVFVHASGFIGGNSTFEGAMEMVKKALEYSEYSGKTVIT